MRTFLTSLIVLAGMVASAQEMEIRVDGMVSFDGSSFSIDEAGSDFQSTIESESSLFLTITSGDEWDKKTNPNRKWKVEVRKEDISWNNEIGIEIVRKGDGWGLNDHKKSKLYNGTSYQTVRDISSYFFGGKGLVSEIPIQFRLSGFSIVQGAGDYETNIILTIYDD